MAIARRNIIDTESPGFYHCTNRCVRRAFLCGYDEEQKRNYDHRKSYLEQRMKLLCDVFAVNIFAYAIMSNHYHIVMYVDPGAPQLWTDKEVATRWLKVFPSRLDKPENSQQREFRIQAIMNSPELLEKYRERLGSISWFMRRLNEPMAKLSNQEDDCTGKFWEGRFTSQALLDEAAVLSCMVYVDLNPVRAKISEKLIDSDFTSIKARLEKNQPYKDHELPNEKLNAVSGSLEKQIIPVSLKDYINLTEWASKSILHPTKATMPYNIESVLNRLNLQSNHWLHQLEQWGNNYRYAVGPVTNIREAARKLSKRYFKGISSAIRLYASN